MKKALVNQGLFFVQKSQLSNQLSKQMLLE
jgi:hypothetical protein